MGLVQTDIPPLTHQVIQTSRIQYYRRCSDKEIWNSIPSQPCSFVARRVVF